MEIKIVGSVYGNLLGGREGRRESPMCRQLKNSFSLWT